MNKVLFLDIDRTLFDPELFLSMLNRELRDFFGLDSNLDLKPFYHDSKKDKGYFDPESFIDNISKAFKVDEKKLQEIFWSNKLIEKCLYPDAVSTRNLSSKITLGIFSKGDYKFQLKKIAFLIDLLDEKNIFVVSNKFESMQSTLSIYQDFGVGFVDDDLNVLLSIKTLRPDAKLFLIDREGDLEDNVGVTKIKSLDELENLI